MKTKKIYILLILILFISLIFSSNVLSISNWYKGDQHMHSNHSWFSWPLPWFIDQDGKNTLSEMADSAKNSNGLSWVIITDHGAMIATHSDSATEWDNIKTECDAKDTTTFKCLRGEEIGEFEHFLAYNNPDLNNFVTSCTFPVNSDPIARVDYKTGNVYDFAKDKQHQSSGKFALKDKLENKVGILRFYPNLNVEQIKSFKGYKGLIIEGTGLGHIPINFGNEINLKAVKDLISSGTVVVLTSQCIFGRVNMNVYSTGRDLLNIGVISGEDMLAETAFIKLAWLLGNYKKDEVKYMLNDNLRGEISERTKYEEEII